MRKVFLCGFIYSVVLIISTYAQQIYINEFMAGNTSTYADMVDFSDFADWIELYNNESFDVDLEGYFISDSKWDTLRWEFPENSIIGAKSYLIVWADGADAYPGIVFSTPFTNNHKATSGYHTNFKLSQDGERISLHNPNGVIMDHIEFGPQLDDVSYGRKPDGGINWYFFSSPTPDTSNSTEGITNLAYTGIPEFSLEGGWYASPQMVSISTSLVNVQIRYTTNGAIPDIYSPVYSGPFYLTTTTVIKARIFQQGKLPGKTITHTYFINEPGYELPVMAYSADPYYLWDVYKGIYTNILKQKEIPVTLEYFDKDLNKGFTVNAGSRIGGRNIWRFAQKPLSIYLRSKYGDDEIKYPLFSERSFGTYGQLMLRNAGDDWERAFFRDALMQHFLVGRMDNGIQAYEPVNLYLNGEYWGLINIREKFDDLYFANNYFIAQNNYDHLKHTYDPWHHFIIEVAEGSRDDYDTLAHFILEQDLSDSENYAYVKSQMDILSYQNWVISEVFMVNTSWPWNHEWWRANIGKDTRWKWMVVDYDRGFDMNRFYREVLNDFTTTERAYLVPPIFMHLLENEEFKQDFIARYTTHIYTTFRKDRVIQLIDSMQEHIRGDLPAHIARWKNDGGIQSIASWEDEVEDMRTFARLRPVAAINELASELELGDSVLISLEVTPTHSGNIYINDIQVTDSNFSNYYFKNTETRVKAVAIPGITFTGWSGSYSSAQQEIELDLSDDISLVASFENTDENMLPDTIRKDTLLFLENSPYISFGDIIVNPNVTLEIEPGVEIRMTEKAGLYVFGNLITQGTLEQPVVIEPNYQAGAEQWGAICFENATDTSFLNYLILSDATKGRDPYKHIAAIASYESDLIMDGIQIKEIYTMPVFTQYGHIELKNSHLHSYATCDLINVKYANYALVENCDLQGNNAFDTDAIDYDQISNGIIRNNYIYDFIGYNSDGIDIGESSENVLIKGNTIKHITDKGISVGQASTVTVDKNIIAWCNQGVGIKDFNSYAQINNTTFYRNNTGIACFEKNFLAGGGGAQVNNSIFADSRDVAVYTDDKSSIYTAYSLTNTGELGGTSNLTALPGFINSAAFNFNLLEESPCIDAGNPTMQKDPDGSRADIGARYFISSVASDLIINEINYKDNSTGLWIEIYNPAGSDIDLTGWKLENGSDSTYTFENNEVINAYSYLVICSNVLNFESKYPEVIGSVGDCKFTFLDSTETLLLKDQSDITIDSVSFAKTDPWPLITGDEASISLVKPYLDNELAENWKSVTDVSPTPGSKNRFDRLFENIFINEFMAINDDLLRDKDNDYNDWIELYNANDYPVNMAGMYISNSFGKPMKYRIPDTDTAAATTIPAHGYLLLWADNETYEGIFHTNFKLDGESDQILIVQPNGIDIIDSISYTNQHSVFSFGRYPDGQAHWKFMTITPKATNLGGTTGAIEHSVITAIDAIVYPNPSRGSINIQGNTSQAEEINMKVFSITGQIMMNKVITKNHSYFETSLDLSFLKEGIYFIKISNPEFSVTKKIILMN